MQNKLKCRPIYLGSPAGNSYKTKAKIPQAVNMKPAKSSALRHSYSFTDDARGDCRMLVENGSQRGVDFGAELFWNPCMHSFFTMVNALSMNV